MELQWVKNKTVSNSTGQNHKYSVPWGLIPEPAVDIKINGCSSSTVDSVFVGLPPWIQPVTDGVVLLYLFLKSTYK